MNHLVKHCSAFLILLATVGLFTLTLGAQEHTKDSPATVKKALAAKTAVLFDVREKSEWDQGHLQDAKLLPLSGLQAGPKLLEGLPKDQPIYLHCRSGGRCVQAAEILRKQGYDARPLKEGYQDLLKEGFVKAKD